MHVTKAKLYWENYDQMARAADRIETMDELRGLHGDELEEYREAFPDAEIQDDHFTMMDDRITDRLQELFASADIHASIVDCFGDYDPPAFAEEECCDSYILWEIESAPMDEDVFVGKLLELSKAFELIRFYVRIQENGEDVRQHYICDGREE